MSMGGSGSGVGSGAASGAMAGSAFGPWGTAIGAVGGGILGALGNKQGGPSLADNMKTMIGLQGMQRSGQLANHYADTGGAQYYPGETVAGLGGMTQQGLNSLYNYGAGGGGIQGALASNNATSAGNYLYSNPTNNQLSTLAQAGGAAYNPAFNPLGAAAEVASAQYNPAFNPLGHTAGLAGAQNNYGYNMLGQVGQQAGQFGQGNYVGTNPAQGYFSAETGGDYLNGNPYLDKMFQAGTDSITRQFQNSIAPSLASQFSAAGRTGSGASADAFGQATQSLGNQLGNYGTNLYGQAYEADRNRQMQGATQLANMNANERAQQLQGLGLQGQLYGQQADLYNTGIANQLAGYGAQGNLYNQGVANQIAGYGAQSNAYNTGIQNQLSALNQQGNNYNLERGLMQSANNNAAGLQNAQYQNLNAMLQSGNAYDAHTQDQLNAQKAQWDFNQNRFLNMAQNYSGLLSGTPGIQQWAGQSNTVPQTNALISGLGGALMGSQIGGLYGNQQAQQLYGGGSPFQSLGAGGLAGNGGLGWNW